jgi:MFS family permease
MSADLTGIRPRLLTAGGDLAKHGRRGNKSVIIYTNSRSPGPSLKVAMSPTVATHRTAERWFLDRGLPAVLTTRARLQSLWSRSAPFLAFTAVGDAFSLVAYEMTGQVHFVGAPPLVQRFGLAISLLAIPLAAGIGWIVARRVSDRGQAIVSTVAVVVGIGTQAVKGHTYQQHWERLAEGVVAVLVILLLTAVGAGSVIGWAVRLALSQFVAAWALLARALPVVLLSVLVFFNTAVWTMASTLSPARFGLALDIFLLIAIAFVVQGTVEHAKPTLMAASASPHRAAELAGTPFEHMPDPSDPTAIKPLTRDERSNVILTLVVAQLTRILTVAWVTQLLFFLAGLVMLTPELLRQWTQHPLIHATLFGVPIPVPQSLINMNFFLGTLTFMYVSARSVGDGEYRHEFLDPMIEDLELTLLARNRYLNNGAVEQTPAVSAEQPPM